MVGVQECKAFRRLTSVCGYDWSENQHADMLLKALDMRTFELDAKRESSNECDVDMGELARASDSSRC